MNNSDQFKLVLLGTDGIGKASLCLRMCNQAFYEETDPTIEDHQILLQVDGRPCVIDIWDTAWTESFRLIEELNIRYGSTCLLVYSITSAASFDALAEFVPLILRVQKAGRPRAILVATKSDLEAERVVPRSKGEDFAQELGIPFFETSAKLDKYVTELFTEAVRSYRQYKKEHPEEKRRKTCLVL